MSIQMQSKMIATVYGLQLATMEDKRYVKVVVGASNPDDKATKGISMMFINCEPEVFDACDIKEFPATCELTMNTQRGGQNKMTERVTSIVQVKPGNQARA